MLNEVPSQANGQLPDQPAQVDQTQQENSVEERPALSSKRHFKFFAVLIVVALVITTVLYYRNHPLPEFVQSTADTLMSKPKNKNTIFQSATTIEQGQAYEINNERYIVESVGRSETTYKFVSAVPQSNEGNTGTPDANEIIVQTSAPQDATNNNIVQSPIPLNTANDLAPNR